MSGEKLYYGPLWPLPTPNQNDSLVSGLSTKSGTAEYEEFAALDIIVSAPSSNTGDVFLVMRADDDTYWHNNNGTVVFCLPPGGSRNIALASYGANKYKLADYGISLTDYDDEYFVCAIMQ